MDALAANTWAIAALGCTFILLMTLVTWLGIQLSARTQFVLLAAEILILLGFSVYALARVWMYHPANSITPSWSWINPFELSASQLLQGVLLALFIYWGVGHRRQRERGDAQKDEARPASRRSRRRSFWC